MINDILCWFSLVIRTTGTTHWAIVVWGNGIWETNAVPLCGIDKRKVI